MTEQPVEQRDALRDVLCRAISDVSEQDWAAGWLVGIERLVWQRKPEWRFLADLCGWPLGYQGEDGWLTRAQAHERFAPGS